MKMKYCIECNRNKATHGDFCDSCFNETKICRRCQQPKSIFKFEKNQKSIRGKVSRRGECRECRSWKKPMSQKARKEFEITSSPPPIGKPFHCPICNRTIIRQYKNDVVLDHLHNTGKIRGWICRMCNNSMGMMEDDVNILKRAIKWLQGTLK
jgi:transcription elongation factor Elf1